MPSLVLPVPLALCRPVEEVHSGAGLSLEPKFDGWRCQVLTGAGRLWSRHGTDLTAPFADLAHAAQALDDCVLDGELVAVLHSGMVAFSKLQSRSGRGPRPGEDFTVHLAVFDLLAVGDTDWRPRRYEARRRRLLELLEEGPALIRPVPATGDVQAALRWVGALGGVEGLVVKPNLPYVAGRSSGWLKWRRMHTSEAAVLGVSGRTPATQCLVLGLPRADGRLRAVGVSLPLAQAVRRELAPVLEPTGKDLAELSGTVGGLPGAAPVSYLPVIANVVVEIEADQERPQEFGRFRHRPRVLRVRGDLTVDLLPPVV
ncbi:ATP-dependent DNA ligase [Streptomyces sp. SD11]|uniref:ATP-dependent DNA ligase n=1 Tax=Streptomyces sp. SD11 TaxID=3452209 RepID=UPI003F886E72